MWDLIKGFAEIKEDYINLLRVIQASAEIIYCEDQLSLTHSDVYGSLYNILSPGFWVSRTTR